MNRKGKLRRQAKETILKSNVMIGTCNCIYEAFKEELSDSNTTSDTEKILLDIILTFSTVADEERAHALDILKKK